MTADPSTRERLLAIAADMEWEADSLLAVHARMRREARGARGDTADGLESTCRSLYARARRARDAALLSEL